MIKVNLLKGIASAPGAVASGTSITSSRGPLDAEMQKRVGLRVGAILLAVALVYLYNMTVVQTQNTRLSSIRAATKKIQDQTTAFGPTAPIVEKYNSEKAMTEKQLNVVKLLAGNRLREVKALDALQSLLTDDTWLNDIHIKDGQLELQGMAHTQAGVAELIRNLSSSAFFTNLQVKSASQEGQGPDPLNKFDLECQIGAAP